MTREYTSYANNTKRFSLVYINTHKVKNVVHIVYNYIII